MKILLIPILFILLNALNAQNTSFVRQLSGETGKDPIEMSELPNRDLMLISKENYINANAKIHSKIYLLSETGRLKDSITFKDSIRSLIVLKIVPTSYGYCLLGEMRENSVSYLWNAKLNTQFKIVSQQFTPTNAIGIILINYTVTKDSGIAVLMALSFSTGFSYKVAKVDNIGNSSIFNSTSFPRSVPVSIFERKDSSGYLILDDYEWIATDSIFNIKYRRDLNFTYNGTYLVPNLQPTALRKNDSTYFYAGRCTAFNNVRRTSDLVFAVFNTFGQGKYFKTIAAAGDTSHRQAGTTCIDTTKDGRFIYWGGTYNYDLSQPFFSLKQAPFILTKLDSAYQVVWQKKYGSDAYYLMEGVLATSDGGCVIYMKRGKIPYFKMFEILNSIMF